MWGGSRSNDGIPNNKTTDSNDIMLSNGPNDTVQKIKFSNYGDDRNPPQFVAAGSWDGTVKVWEIGGRETGYGATA